MRNLEENGTTKAFILNLAGTKEYVSCFTVGEKVHTTEKLKGDIIELYTEESAAKHARIATNKLGVTVLAVPTVVVKTYGTRHKFTSVEEAKDFYADGMSFCDPGSSEYSRYAEAFMNLRELGVAK